MSLRARILFYVVSVMAIVFVMVVAAILPGTLHNPKVQQAVARDAALTLKSLFENLNKSEREKLLKGSPNFFSEQNVLEGWVLANDAGKILYWAHPSDPQDDMGPTAELPRFDFHISLQSRDDEILRVHVSTARAASRDGLDWWSVFLVMAVGTVLLAVVVYALLLRLVIHPVERLASATRSSAAARGLLLPVAGTERNDEIGELVRAYNKMVAEVNDLRRTLEERVQKATGDLQAAQEQLVMSDRLSMAGRLAAGVAHEVNNPLGGMLNAARTLQSRAADGSREREYLDLILDGLGRIQHTMSALLQFSRPAQSDTSVDVVEALDGALLFCRHRCSNRGIEVVKNFDASGGKLSVRGHRSELGQVFLNLLVNAIDALEAKDIAPMILTLSVSREGARVIASVSDNGTGMPDEVKAKAGQFFFSTKGEGKGTGLGLAIAQHIVVQHKGRLEIESAPKTGTVVKVLLPAEDDGADVPDSTAEQLQHQGK